MKTLLITHTDLDGISPIILLNLTNIKFDYKNFEINEITSEFDKLFETDLKSVYDLIYICDLTVPDEVYQKLNDLGIKYLVFDHHESHMYATNYPGVCIKTNFEGKITCATVLFYDYLTSIYPNLNKTSVKEYTELVRQLDTFTFESDDGRDLDIIRETIGKTKFIQTITRRLKGPKEHFEFTSFEKRFTKLKKEELYKFMELKETKMLTYEIQNKKCGVVFSEKYKSELGNYLSNKHPELDLIILIDASSRISYRTSKDDIRLNEFSALYGGGGHPKASGSPFDDTMRDKIIKMYYEDAKELEL